MPVKSPTAEALKKLSRYCCHECGAKELFLYCWKGCRHVQGIKSFYADTLALRKELETLQATVYTQELRFRDLELQLKEKQQCLDFLAQQVASLHDSVECAAAKVRTEGGAVHASGLPNWATVGVKMLWRAFADGQSELNAQAVDRLKQHLRATHRDAADSVLAVGGDGDAASDVRANALALLPLYSHRDGASRLKDDLRSLGILLGSSSTCADAISADDARLDQIAVEFAHLKSARDALQSRVDDGERAKARLREAYASTASSAESQARELLALADKHARAAADSRTAGEKASEFRALLRRCETDLAAANRAALDLRALVEDQVAEKERWQQYCWELEERLHHAVETSRAKERDLWQVRGSKKEETRRAMLLYMEAGKGKRHAVPTGPAGGLEAPASATPADSSSQPTA